MATSGEERPVQTRATAITLAVLGLFVLIASIVRTQWGDADLEGPDASEAAASRDTESPESRTRVRSRPAEQAAVATTEPAVARDANGNALAGGPPPYEEATGGYFFISVVSADGARELATVRPDHEGRFTLPEEARSARVRLYALPESGGGALEYTHDVRWAEISGTTIVFVGAASTTTVSVRCVDDSGMPVQGRVQLERSWGNDWRVVDTRDTDERGHASFTSVSAGQYRARLISADSRSKRFVRPPEKRFVASGQDDVVVVDFVLPRAAEINVTVVDEQGRPLSGAIVGLRVVEEGRSRPHPQGRSTDENGQVRLVGIEPGQVGLYASKLGRLPVSRSRTVVSGVNHETFALVPGGHRLLVGFADLPDDFPVGANVNVHLLRVSNTTSEMVAYWGGSLTDDYRLDLAGLPPGEYQLMLMPTAGRRAALWFRMADSDTDLGVRSLVGVFDEGDLSAAVRVDDSDGGQGSGPMVLYRSAAWEKGWWRRTGVWLGSDTAIDGLAPGTYTFRLSPQSHDPDTWDLSDTATADLPGEGASTTISLRIRRRDTSGR